LTTTLAENPGFVTVIKPQIIEKARDKYFETIIDLVGHQVIPEVDAGDMKVTNIRIDLSNPSPSNLQIAFKKDINAIGVSVLQTKIDVAVDWKYHTSIFSESGNAKVDGTLGGISMDIAMTKLADGPFFIPQIDVQNTQVNLDKGAFSLDLHCHNCPGFVEKWIRDWLKDKLLDEVRDQIKSQVPVQANQIGNANLAQLYPRGITLYEDIDIATGLTDVVTIQDDHLEVLIDATVFPHDQGYKRPGAAGDIPHYNPQDPGEIMLFVGEYLLDTLSNTINLSVESYSTSVLGFGVVASLDPAVGKTAVTFEEGDFIVTATPTITVTALQTSLVFEGKAKLSPKISNGDKVNMFSITPKVGQLELESMKLVTPGDTYDLSPVMNYLNGVFIGFLNTFIVPKIPIKKLDVLPLHVANNELDFHAGYSELGLLFDLSQQ